MQTCIVEEARWYKDEDDEDYERVIVKTYRPNMVTSNLELQELLEECKRINGLRHRYMLLGTQWWGARENDMHANLYPIRWGLVRPRGVNHTDKDGICHLDPALQPLPHLMGPSRPPLATTSTCTQQHVHSLEPHHLTSVLFVLTDTAI